jgi:HNH endonuclease
MNAKLCIFCRASSHSSVSREHIVPESLGNRKIRLPRGVVCDKCNNYFSRKIEDPLLNSLFFSQERFMHSIPNKEGRIPPSHGLLFPLGIPVSIGRHPGNEQSIYATRDSDNDRLVRHLMHSKTNTAYFPAATGISNKRLMARMLGKMALEALALRAIEAGIGTEEITHKKELDELREFVRYDRGPKHWPYHERRIYPAGFVFVSGAEAYEVLHEFTLLYTDAHELFFIFANLGVEYVLNLGGPTIEGYSDWLNKNSNRSPLYNSDKPE